MTKREKIEAFIQILENWFEDSTEEIDHNNCIGFYNHLIYSLKFELKVSVDYNRNLFFNHVYNLLLSFNEKIDNKEFSTDFTNNKNTLLTNKELEDINLGPMFSELLTIYNTAKEEYLLK